MRTFRAGWVLLAFLAGSCVSAHPDQALTWQNFFKPSTPGYLVVPAGSSYCGRAYGLRVYAPTAANGGIGAGEASLLDECPNMLWLTEITKEAAQTVPLTISEMGTFRLALVDPDTELTQDGRFQPWITDGYTILCKPLREREALRDVLPRAGLLR